MHVAGPCTSPLLALIRAQPMVLLPTPTSTPWPQKIFRVLSVSLLVLSTLILGGWWLDFYLLTQWFSRADPVEPSAALGFFFLGLALLGFERRWRYAGLFALPAGLLGLVNGVACILSWLSYNQGWWTDELLLTTHLATAVVLSFLLASVGLTWLGVHRPVRYRTLMLALAGSISLSVGFATLTGYAFNLPAVYRWGDDVNIPAATAVLLLVLGLALLLLGWREHQKIRPGAPPWITIPVVVISATLTLIIWAGLRERERAYIGLSTQAAINSFASNLTNEFTRLGDSVERLALRWSESPDLSPSLREVDARSLLEESPGCSGVTLLDSALRTSWVYPQRQNLLLSFNHSSSPERRAALEAARPKNSPAAISATLPPLSSGFAIYAPIYHGDRFAGYAGAEFPYRHLFEVIEQRLRLASQWHLSIHIGGTVLYTTGPDGDAGKHRLESVFNIADRRFRIGMSPTNAALQRGRQHLPELALGAGFGITLLLGLSVHLARSARSSLHTARLSNQRLIGENDHRRRIEEQLKLSDERLRLALDATHIGISEWTLPGNELYYSPGLWTLLGYKPGDIAATPQAWTSLIHPEDLPGYRVTVEQQLAGTVTFIDHEYRVLTAAGSWRWLHSRAKTVARTEAGTPARIIGTLQDITSRKEAEVALRLSQAATRKLSLVASRTDNLVIIARPDGTVEWVNESFERVLEYKLADVAGRHPSDFMIGPDTNPRTLHRIQTAMRRGEGLSTDIASYSKSGRKFHLHLEIQAARNEAGELENFIAVLADITARVETEHNLRRAKSEADAASKAKSEFLASMSHEIRTPMNGVIGMTSLLLDTKLDAEQREYVATIRNSGEALLTIINDILDFSKIESGKMEIERQPFELAICIEDVLDLMSVPAAAKNLDLSYCIDDDVPAWIQGDVTRLRQILLNLVNNAVKFTPAGGVAITVRRLPAVSISESNPSTLTLEFSVTDTGIGIPPDRLNRLFRAFSQVDSSTTRKFGGTGLGLAICQRLCALMGGDIRVTSTPGVGSSFIFTLLTDSMPVPPGWGLPEAPAALNYGPVLCFDENTITLNRLQNFLQSWGVRPICVSNAEAVQHALSAEILPVALILDHKFLSKESHQSLRAQLIASDLPILLLTQPSINAQQLDPFAGRRATATATKPLRTPSLVRGLQSLFGATPESIPPFPRTTTERLLAQDIPLNILLAEDNPVNQKVAHRYLERLGYRADFVSNGLEALNTLEARSYDLVFMDLQMPEMDGLESSRQIRQRLPAERQPKIIALTANALQGDRELCIAAGMDDYITKPVKLQEIANIIRRIFGPDQN
jgi:PAS domain S-box-containing protein